MLRSKATDPARHHESMALPKKKIKKSTPGTQRGCWMRWKRFQLLAPSSSAPKTALLQQLRLNLEGCFTSHTATALNKQPVLSETCAESVPSASQPSQTSFPWRQPLPSKR